MLIDNLFAYILTNKDFYRRTFPNIKKEWFTDLTDRIIFDKLKSYDSARGKIPTISDLKLMIETDSNISEVDSDDAYKRLDSMKDVELVGDIDLLVDETEKWAQDRALELAILDGINILENPKNGTRGQIEEKVRDALAVQFDIRIGHDYYKDVEARLEAYQTDEEKMPFNSTAALNEATKGGLRKKALFVFMGRPNIGKTLWLCHMAAECMRAGQNVLYVTGEMAEMTGITRRIDANMLDIAMDDLSSRIDKRHFLTKIKECYNRSKGRLIVKEYPPGTATSHHIRSLIQEIKLKKGVTIDVVFIDYLNLFQSHRLPASAMSNSYLYVKAVAEELRGLAVEFNVPVVTATQINRGSSNATATELDMTGTSESFGIPMTADFMGGIIQSPELFEQCKYIVKVIKSRYGDNINEYYTVGVDRARMRLFDLEDAEKEIPVHVKDKLLFQQREANKKLSEDSFDFGE